MTTIYCDASCDAKLGLSAWACTVTSEKGKTTVFTGQYPKRGSAYCELMAVIKALGKVKTYQGKIKAYTDLKSIADAVAAPKKQGKKKSICGEWNLLWAYLKRYQQRLTVVYIPHKKNLAHVHAKAALNRLRNNEPLIPLYKA